jgi:hypothetical protein
MSGRKKEYKSVVMSVINEKSSEFTGLSKREIINVVYNHIIQNNLIVDYSETSLYNTIYYFLRKKNIFNVEEINYRFDSILSKMKFLELLRGDMEERWWFYHDLFFGDVDRPVLDAKTKVVSGNLNYIIDSGIDSQYDFLYTLLYFRDLRKVVTSDMATMFVKRPLNSKLYGMFSELYKLDELTKIMVDKLSDQEKKQLLDIMINFFTFLSQFNNNEFAKLQATMIKSINVFKTFILNSSCPEILSYNKDRYFDALTFVSVVYTMILKHINVNPQLLVFTNILYLINSTTYFVFFKFSKKLKKQHFSKIVDYFDSDLYFSYIKYIVEYYNVFMNQAKKILEQAGNNADETLKEFDIILRYMLYNKLRNLINSNLKRYMSVDFDINDESFMDVNTINDYVLYECNLFCESDPEDSITEKKFTSIYEDFFKGREEGINKDDVTNIAIEICNGHTRDFGEYDKRTLELSYELVALLKDEIQ